MEKYNLILSGVAVPIRIKKARKDNKLELHRAVRMKDGTLKRINLTATVNKTKGGAKQVSDIICIVKEYRQVYEHEGELFEINTKNMPVTKTKDMRILSVVSDMDVYRGAGEYKWVQMEDSGVYSLLMNYLKDKWMVVEWYTSMGRVKYGYMGVQCDRLMLMVMHMDEMTDPDRTVVKKIPVALQDKFNKSMSALENAEYEMRDAYKEELESRILKKVGGLVDEEDVVEEAEEDNSVTTGAWSGLLAALNKVDITEKSSKPVAAKSVVNEKRERKVVTTTKRVVKK